MPTAASMLASILFVGVGSAALSGCVAANAGSWDVSAAGTGQTVQSGSGGQGGSAIDAEQGGQAGQPAHAGEAGYGGDAPDAAGQAGSPNASGSGGAAGQGEGAPDYPNIARIALPGSWTAHADGSWTYPGYETNPFNALGLSFYAEHPDDYDFLAVYTEGDLLDFGALAVGLVCDIQGIGVAAQQCTTSPAQAGSAGRLQQFNIMNAPHWYKDWSWCADVLVHETTHRWAAFIELPQTPAPRYLLDNGGGHWNVHVHTGGPSAVGYGDLTDLGGGNFKFQLISPLKLSPLELYLAGLIPALEVAPMFYVANAYGYSPAQDSYGQPFNHGSYYQDVAYSGTRVDFDINDVIAANGPRVPAYGDAPKHLRFAFVLVCQQASSCKQSDLAIVEAQRVAFVSDFAAATGGRATVDTRLQP